MRLGIVTAIFICIQICIYKYAGETQMNADLYQNIMKQENQVVQEQNNTKEDNIWQIEIKSISLIADIEEYTSQEVLNKKVGHFVETQKEIGNVGLAAHNRGYEVNFFEKLKLLKEGDEIIYRHNEFEMIYEVSKNIIIKDTDWEHLENTEDNMLTLITCVENEPNYRRCVKTIEKESEENY